MMYLNLQHKAMEFFKKGWNSVCTVARRCWRYRCCTVNLPVGTWRRISTSSHFADIFIEDHVHRLSRLTCAQTLGKGTNVRCPYLRVETSAVKQRNLKELTDQRCSSLHSHISHNNPQFLYLLWRRANARKPGFHMVVSVVSVASVVRKKFIGHR